MTGRPLIAPSALAAVVEGVPARLVRRLDADPGLALAWSWVEVDGRHEVSTDQGERVILSPSGGVVREVGGLSCTCLLSPRCLHLLAVASVLAVADEVPVEPPAGGEGAAAVIAAEAIEVTSEAQRAAAGALWAAAAAVLAVGLERSGVVLTAELIRAVHGARLAGLHRAAGAGGRLVRQIRELRGVGASFRLDRCVRDLGVLLETTARVRGGEVAALGVGRRTYSAQGNLRLYGILSEPISDPGGFAGVVTTLVDARGRFWTRAEVRPGAAEQATAAYETSAGLGELALVHRELCRSVIQIEGSTGSEDGRLGAGAGVRAVRAGLSSWAEGSVSGLWSVGLREQLERAHEGIEADPGAAGAGLIFVRVEVQGLDGALLVALGPQGEPLLLTAGEDQPLGLSNLRQLARLPGSQLAIIARPEADRPGIFRLLAVGEQSPGVLRLPDAWAGRVNVALDAVVGASLGPAARRTAQEVGVRAALPPDPLAAARRRLNAVALGGAAALPPSALSALEREAAALDRGLMVGGAALLRALGVEAQPRARDLRGALSSAEVADPSASGRAGGAVREALSGASGLAWAWAALSVYVRRFDQRVQLSH